MGCSAAKSLTAAVEPLDGGTKVTQLSDGVPGEPRKISIPRRASDLPPLESAEPLTEILGNDDLNNMHQTQSGLSFDIPLEEDGVDSIIKKHPPRRFQKLEEEERGSPTLSLVKLQEKLDEAEIRRQQILQQRIQSAKYRNTLKKQASVTSGSEEDGVVRLKVPPDVPTVANPYDVSYV